MTAGSIENMKKAYLSVIVFLIALFLGSSFYNYSGMIFHGRQYDDSYITYRYAVNLAEGKGFVFNSYEKVNSANSFLYTLALAGLYKLGFQDLERVAALLGLASGCLLILFTSLLVFRIIANPFLATLLLLPLFISGSISGWAVSGMETIFFSMLIMAFLWAYSTDRFVVSVALLAACLLTRFEATLLFASLLLAEWVEGGFRLRNRRLATFAVTGLVSFGGLIAFYACYYGTPVPHPVLFKKYALYYSHPFLTSLEDTLTFSIKNFSLYSIPGIGFTFWVIWNRFSAVSRMSIGTSRAPHDAEEIHRLLISPSTGGSGAPVGTFHVLTAVYILLSLLSFIVGPASDQNRYMTHLFPVLAVATARVFHDVAVSGVAPRRIAIILGALLFAGASYQAARNQMRMAQFFSRTTSHQMALEEMGHWIRDHVPAGHTILSSDIGAIACFAKSHNFIDACGLTSKAPVMALEKKDWSFFIKELKKKKPLWAADTGLPDGEISAIKIIRRPSEFYHGLSAQEEPYRDLDTHSHETVLRILVGDAYALSIVKIDLTVYESRPGVPFY